MPDQKLVGQNYTPPDLVAKVTGRAKYAEDYRADGMLFTKLLLSPMPHARVRRIDTRAALAMPGVKAILTADDLPDLRGAERALTNEPLYQGEPILAVAAVDERTAAEAIERIDARSRAAAVRHRSGREPAAGQRERAPRRQRLGDAGAGARRARRSRPRPKIQTLKWTAQDFANAPEGGAADGRGARRVVVRRSRRRLQERRGRRRRNLRRAVDRPSADGNAQRDGLLAERQAVSARLDAERRADASIRSPSWVGIDASNIVLDQRVHAAAASAARAPARCRWRFRRCCRRRPARR